MNVKEDNHVFTGALPAQSVLNALLLYVQLDFLMAEMNKPCMYFENLLPYEAHDVREFFIANGALDCGGIISPPKLKTQGFLNLTRAVKNQLGCIPGRRKGAYDAQLQRPADFARILIDLNRFLHPRLLWTVL